MAASLIFEDTDIGPVYFWVSLEEFFEFYLLKFGRESEHCWSWQSFFLRKSSVARRDWSSYAWADLNGAISLNPRKTYQLKLLSARRYSTPVSEFKPNHHLTVSLIPTSNLMRPYTAVIQFCLITFFAIRHTEASCTIRHSNEGLKTVCKAWIVYSADEIQSCLLVSFSVNIAPSML